MVCRVCGLRCVPGLSGVGRCHRNWLPASLPGEGCVPGAEAGLGGQAVSVDSSSAPGPQSLQCCCLENSVLGPVGPSPVLEKAPGQARGGRGQAGPVSEVPGALEALRQQGQFPSGSKGALPRGPQCGCGQRRPCWCLDALTAWLEEDRGRGAVAGAFWAERRRGLPRRVSRPHAAAPPEVLGRAGHGGLCVAVPQPHSCLSWCSGSPPSPRPGPCPHDGDLYCSQDGWPGHSPA